MAAKNTKMSTTFRSKSNAFTKTGKFLIFWQLIRYIEPILSHPFKAEFNKVGQQIVKWQLSINKPVVLNIYSLI